MPAESLACTPLVRIHLVTPLPCGIHGCQQLAQVALAEPDPTFPGLWSILPLCPKCLAGRLGSLLPPAAGEIGDTSNAPATPATGDQCASQLQIIASAPQRKSRGRRNSKKVQADAS